MLSKNKNTCSYFQRELPEPAEEEESAWDLSLGPIEEDEEDKAGAEPPAAPPGVAGSSPELSEDLTPLGTNSGWSKFKKSQIRIVSSWELLTIWNSSNCSRKTRPVCF